MYLFVSVLRIALQHDQRVLAITEALAMTNLSGDGAGTPTPSFNPGPGQPGSAQVNMAPPTPSATNWSVTAPSPSAVNGAPTINPATQPTTSLPEVPASFLTNEFMQSVASTLDDFDTQTLFRPDDTGVNFERDFREWFNPDDLDNDFDTQAPNDTLLDFERDFREWFNPDDLDMK